MPRSPSQPRSSDVHALWDALADFPASQSDAALILLQKTLCQWTGADSAFWAGVVRVTSGAAARRDPLRGWRARAVAHTRRRTDSAALARRGMRSQDTDPPLDSHALTAHAGTFRVHRLHDGLVDLTAFRRTLHYRVFYEALGVSDRMWAICPVNQDAESYIVLDHTSSRRRFSAADAGLVGRALRSTRWFHRQLLLSHGLPLASAPLSPAERRVLLLLLGGLPKKDIARKAGLRGGTVHKYAADVYRKLGVKGRAELAALWLGGR